MFAICSLPASELGTNQFRCLLRPNRTKAKTHLNIYNLSKDINTRLSSINKYISGRRILCWPHGHRNSSMLYLMTWKVMSKTLKGNFQFSIQFTVFKFQFQFRFHFRLHSGANWIRCGLKLKKILQYIFFKIDSKTVETLSLRRRLGLRCNYSVA